MTDYTVTHRHTYESPTCELIAVSEHVMLVPDSPDNGPDGKQYDEPGTPPSTGGPVVEDDKPAKFWFGQNELPRYNLWDD